MVRLQKAVPCTWTEMNWEVYTKQMEHYSFNLQALIKKEESIIKARIESDAMDRSNLTHKNEDEVSPEILQQVALCEKKYFLEFLIVEKYFLCNCFL